MIRRSGRVSRPPASAPCDSACCLPARCSRLSIASVAAQVRVVPLCAQSTSLFSPGVTGENARSEYMQPGKRLEACPRPSLSITQSRWIGRSSTTHMPTHHPPVGRSKSSNCTALPNACTCTDRPFVPSIASQVFMAITAGRGGWLRCAQHPQPPFLPSSLCPADPHALSRLAQLLACALAGALSSSHSPPPSRPPPSRPPLSPPSRGNDERPAPTGCATAHAALSVEPISTYIP